MEENTMEKEKILEMSRQENKDRDLYELEVNRKAGTYAAISIITFCTFLYILNILAGNGTKLELFAPTAINMAIFHTYRYKKSNIIRKYDLFAVVCSIIAAVITVVGSVIAVFIK